MVTKKISATDCATFKKIERKQKLLADAQNINYTKNEHQTTPHFPTPQHKNLNIRVKIYTHKKIWGRGLTAHFINRYKKKYLSL